ncbi:hypothetical protein [Selenihalanaerobacter shriftii]|uniref:CAAX protease self-immunity n=1 Tax=Selenihalanaerobacter shriftii TaxID=142842 RepID=A0A1T4N561_9FIRM|nr:hypothetical protein [Selenihalanaerobacter shriftii]SJZ74256.1 hypothetical protein SAMN02745118_01693 [Selenihalanaerobacter shriftii]
MNIILVGLIAAVVTMLINRYLVAEAGNLVIIYLVPFVEEVVKSFSAYFWQTNILLVHLVFGAIEAIYDFYSTSEHGVLAGSFSLLGHFAFGYITLFIYLKSNSILLGVLAATTVHTLWNYIVLTKIGGN